MLSTFLALMHATPTLKTTQYFIINIYTIAFNCVIIHIYLYIYIYIIVNTFIIRHIDITLIDMAKTIAYLHIIKH